MGIVTSSCRGKSTTRTPTSPRGAGKDSSSSLLKQPFTNIQGKQSHFYKPLLYKKNLNVRIRNVKIHFLQGTRGNFLLLFPSVYGIPTYIYGNSLGKEVSFNILSQEIIHLERSWKSWFPVQMNSILDQEWNRFLGSFKPYYEWMDRRIWIEGFQRFHYFWFLIFPFLES